jgi:hypothetical protein
MSVGIDDPVIQRDFIENRSRLLDLAAYLDRVERASARAGLEDFRIAALLLGIQELLRTASTVERGRVERVHAVLSDQTSAPLDSAQKSQSAWGAPQSHCC